MTDNTAKSAKTAKSYRVVYRIENETGSGLFQAALEKKNGYEPWDVVLLHEMYGMEWPMPVGPIPRYYIFGFDSKEQLSEWFPEETRAQLRAWGLNINAYEVPETDVIDEVGQVIFNPMFAKRLENQNV